jgi:membrane associated rhomboid family serine protease
MDSLVVVVLAIIVGGVVYSYWKQLSYSIVACACCAMVFGVEVLAPDPGHYLYSDLFYDIAFNPQDLTDMSRIHTVVTSMYAHVDFYHIFLNMLGLAFLGTAFEQRIGTRPFIVIYLFAGLCGTLLFAGLRWNDAFVVVVGASGAISGVLGAFARMYPNERMSLIILVRSLPPMPIWVIVGLFLLLQVVFVAGDPRIAVEAHLGGLIGGMAVAPYVARLPLHRRVKRMISINALRRLARTPELKAILRRIEEEEIPDVKSAWIAEFLSKARCPHCGSSIKVSRESITCSRGHLL